MGGKAATIFKKAQKTVHDKGRMYDLILRTGKKLKGFATHSLQWKEFRAKVMILMQMIQCHISGEYRTFSLSSIILVVFALIYFITPTDVIPDFIPAIGFTDDASVLFLIYRKLSKDIEKFLNRKNRDGSVAKSK